MKLAGATFGYLYTETLSRSLESLAGHGFDTFELTPLPPHFYEPTADSYARQGLKRTMRSLGLSCSSVNPSYSDLNLISVNKEFADLSLRQLKGLLELAVDLDAETLVVSPGRRHPLGPVPDELAWEALSYQLGDLSERGVELGVDIGLENSPYGFGDHAGDLVAAVEAVGFENLGIVYDCANAPQGEAPSDGVRTVAEHLKLVHVSDTSPSKHAHDHIGDGTVDFTDFYEALVDIDYRGLTIFELIVTTHPEERLEQDLTQLASIGWSPAA